MASSRLEIILEPDEQELIKEAIKLLKYWSDDDSVKEKACVDLLESLGWYDAD